MGQKNDWMAIAVAAVIGFAIGGILVFTALMLSESPREEAESLQATISLLQSNLRTADSKLQANEKALLEIDSSREKEIERLKATEQEVSLLIKENKKFLDRIENEGIGVSRSAMIEAFKPLEFSCARAEPPEMYIAHYQIGTIQLWGPEKNLISVNILGSFKVPELAERTATLLAVALNKTVPSWKPDERSAWFLKAIGRVDNDLDISAVHGENRITLMEMKLPDTDPSHIVSISQYSREYSEANRDFEEKNAAAKAGRIREQLAK